jgi:hypothetical protein
MLNTFNFTDNDISQVKRIPKSLLVYVLYFFIICIPGSFLFGLIGLTKKGNGYWTTTLIIIAIFFIVTLLLITKDLILYKRDMIEQIKYAGTITILNKSTKKGQTKIFTDSKEFPKITLHSSDISDRINSGDQLNIEISKYSKTIFLLKNGDTDLLLC